MALDKHYYKIGEVAHIVGVKPSVLRFWETEFPNIKPEKSRTNQRVYTQRQVERIMQIKHLLYGERFTIEGAKKALRQGEGKTWAEERLLLLRIQKEAQELLDMSKT